MENPNCKLGGREGRREGVCSVTNLVAVEEKVGAESLKRKRKYDVWELPLLWKCNGKGWFKENGVKTSILLCFSVHN